MKNLIKIIAIALTAISVSSVAHSASLNSIVNGLKSKDTHHYQEKIDAASYMADGNYYEKSKLSGHILKSGKKHYVAGKFRKVHNVKVKGTIVYAGFYVKTSEWNKFKSFLNIASETAYADGWKDGFRAGYRAGWDAAIDYVESNN